MDPRELAAEINNDLQDSTDIDPSPDYPGEIEADWSQHCSTDDGCDDCEYSDLSDDCPGS